MAEQPTITSDETIFSTKDLYLAATLVTLKFYMVGVDYQIEGMKNNPIGYFKFDDSAALRDARQKYIQGLIVVDPREYQQNVFMLKSEVHNMASNPHHNIHSV